MQRERNCHRFVTVLLTLAFTLVGASAVPVVFAEPPPIEPERITAVSSHGMVAADHPAASQVGAQILDAGGNAIDAGVGTLLALGVVNPFASGLGGGGFCLIRPADGEVEVLDFRERAPGKAHRDMYIVDGEADVDLTVYGGLAVGVPSEARGLETLHQKYGTLDWAKVVRPARRLAANGFEVGELLPKRLKAKEDKLQEHDALAAAFRRNGRWVSAGDTLKRPGLGKALKMLETRGAEPFHSGPIAKAIVERVNAAGGVFTMDDLEGYQVTWREPLVGEYRGYEIYAMPPPSSGGTTILETLNILERYDLKTLGQSTESTHRITEAMKHAFADRARWLGDADFVEVPVERLTSEQYAAERRVRPDGVLETEEYGTSAPPPDDDGTSHVSVIDDDGTMLACTSTINTSFGSLVYVPEFGMVLNNEMGDFTAQPGVPNVYGLMGTEQNTVEPGKRPLSSMSPTLVLRNGEPYVAVGASGGPTIITGTLLALIRVLDWNTTPAEAIALPRIHHQWLPNEIFAEAMSPAARATLESRGHEVTIRDAYNSVQMVIRKADGSLVGVSDPRKMGQPAGAKK